MDNRIREARKMLETLFAEFKLSEALKTIYSLIWDDFCSWYLEWIKPAQEEALPRVAYDRTIDFFTRLIQLLHPFMPFITEELWHQLPQPAGARSIALDAYPEVKAPLKDREIFDLLGFD